VTSRRFRNIVVRRNESGRRLAIVTRSLLLSDLAISRAIEDLKGEMIILASASGRQVAVAEIDGESVC
jgi:hypothetical protein